MSNGAVQVAQPAAVDQLDAEQQRQLIRETYGRGLNDAEFELLMADAAHRGLDVVTRDVSAIKFGQGPAVMMVTVGGLRKLADRSGVLADTEGPLFCGPDGVWLEVWLDEKTPPKAAKFTVWRTDRSRPITAVVTFAERAQRTGQGQLMPTWRAMPAHMLGKVAESDAYKKARLVPDFRGGDPEPEARKKAYGRLFAVAEAQGMDDQQARAVVRSLAPGMESLTDEDVDVDDIHDAASLIEAIGEEAIPDDAEYVDLLADADPETGEIAGQEPNEREQWRIRYRDVIDSQDRTSLNQIIADAGETPWKWQDLIERASSLAMANKLRDLARGKSLRDEDVAAWHQTYVDGQAVSAQRARATVADIQAAAQAGIPGVSGKYDHLGH